jgi:hypothetical protein
MKCGMPQQNPFLKLDGAQERAFLALEQHQLTDSHILWAAFLAALRDHAAVCKIAIAHFRF